MNRSELYTLARTILDSYGLQNLPIRIGSAKNQAGSVMFHYGQPKFLRLSAPIAALNSREDTEDTIRHEVAHVLAGLEAGHGPEWQTVARYVGASPDRTHNLETPASKFLLVCRHCDYSRPRHRRTNTIKSCGKCCPSFNPDYLLVFIDNPDYITT